MDNIALREAVINAIAHNDYSTEIPPVVEIFSNRMMITSAGGLPQNLSREEFLEGVSAPRNKEIMRIFKDVKLVEHLGSGVKRILETYDESVFNISQNFIRVTFMFDKELIDDGIDVGIKGFKLSKNQEKILIAIGENNNITQKKLTRLLDVTERTIQRNTTILQENGLLMRIGSTKSGHWVVKKGNNKE